MGNLLGLIGGAAIGAAVGEVTARLPERAGAIAGGLGLVTAAAIYPLARREGGDGVAIEVGVLALTAGLAAAAARQPTPTARRLIAVGWASHALFDILQGRTGDSRLPAWYPAFCAGYDGGYAVRSAV